jgi:hypothetical protein
MTLQLINPENLPAPLLRAGRCARNSTRRTGQ